MFVHMYICTYVCMYVCIRTYVCMYVCMYVYVHMYVCMYVCIRTYFPYVPHLPLSSITYIHSSPCTVCCIDNLGYSVLILYYFMVSISLYLSSMSLLFHMLQYGWMITSDHYQWLVDLVVSLCALVANSGSHSPCKGGRSLLLRYSVERDEQ